MTVGTRAKMPSSTSPAKRMFLRNDENDAITQVDASRSGQLYYLMSFLQKRGEIAADELQRAIFAQQNVEANGIVFDCDVLKEAHQSWLALHSLESLRREAQKAIWAAPDAAFGASQAKLATLRAQLADPLPDALQAYRATLRYQLSKAQALEQEAIASHDAQQKVLQDLSAERRKAQSDMNEAEIRLQGYSSDIAEIEKRLQELRNLYGMEKEALYRHSLAESGLQQKIEAVKEQASSSKLAKEEANAEHARVDEALAELDRRQVEVEGLLVALTDAVAERERQCERQFLTWSPEEVASWLRRIDVNGRFTAHADEFQAQGVRGDMLEAATQEDLVALGVRDFGTRRELLAEIRKLRAIVRVADPTPPVDLVCPITGSLLEDAVAIAGDVQGQAYERSAIQRWFDTGNYSVPATGVALHTDADCQLFPLRALSRQAQTWRREHFGDCPHVAWRGSL
mmetsp:Transcript_126130/g.223411  ORF Transcript_126130/g.223411 Transcript_126130/m.223411 type:complete len:457 (-) Transcript_126130:19-1389(-)